MTPRAPGPALKAERVGRSFGGRRVVEGVSLELSPGRVHALVGENGAGKSTLLKMLAGVLAADEGEVWVGGRRLEPATPAEAARRGVGMVFQHFALVDALTGLENLMLGAEPVGRFGLLRPAVVRAAAVEAMRALGAEVPLDEPAGRLTVGQRQRLEIVRALARGARALLLDEPTAVLPRAEADELLAWLRRLAEGGATVALVTHRLDEVARFADEVTVLRGGRVVAREAAGARSAGELAALALGELPAIARAPAPEGAPERLRLEGASTAPSDEAPVGLDGVSLAVRRGEVVGVAGVEGNGQEALVLALAGLLPLAAGRLSVDGEALPGGDVGAHRRAGVEVVHADRHRRSLVLPASVHDNLVLAEAGGPDEAELGRRRLAASGLAPADPGAPAASLSGGNQQKLVMARALDRAPRVLVAAHPTRGVDAAAAAALHGRLAAAAAGGASVLLVSADLGELRSLAHRLVVVSRGKLVAEFGAGVAEAELGRAMLAGGAA